MEQKHFYKSFCARCVTLLVLALLSVSNVWGADFTLTSENSVTTDGITVAFEQGSGTSSPAWYAAGLRLYAKNTVTISSDKNITNVTFNWEKQGKKDFASVTANTGTYSHPSAAGIGSWTGSAKSITFTLGNSGQLQLNTLSVTVESETPATPCTVTFDGNEHGTPAKESLTEASAGVGVELPSCTPNDGYAFKGWATTSDATYANAGQTGNIYKPSKNCTLYAVYAKTYVLTITQPTYGGILTVKNGDTQLETGATVEVGTNLTCEVTDIPEGKRFSRFYANWDNDQSKYKQTNPATFDNIATENITECTISVTYQDLKKCTINYYVNGVNTDPQENVYEGTKLLFPEVADIAGKKFMGWVTETISIPTDEQPTFVTTTGLTATENIDYYAVFANAEEGGTGEYKNVTSFTVGKTYIFGAVKAAASPTLANNTEIGAVAFKNTYTDKTNNWGAAVGITPDANGIISETEKTLKDDCKWVLESKSDGNYQFKNGSNYIYIGDKLGSTSNGAQSGVNTDEGNMYLEDVNATCAKAFLIHPTATSTSVMLWNTSYGYRMYDPRSYNATMAPYIRFYEYQPGFTYSNYCTTVPPRTYNVTISTTGFSTGFAPFDAKVEGATAYQVTVNGNVATLVEIENVIPANTGVILYGTANATATFTETEGELANVKDNKLVAATETYTCTEADYGKVFYLGSNDGKAAFKMLAVNGTIAAGKAYLKLNEALTAGAKLEVVFGDEPTGIEGINCIMPMDNQIYNLQGVRVNNIVKGNIYIVNGKKYLAK